MKVRMEETMEESKDGRMDESKDGRNNGGK